MATEEDDIAIPNITGDEGFAETEKKMKELDELKQKRVPFRPGSNKGRPESAHNPSKQGEKMDAAKIYTNFSLFINHQEMMRDAFCPKEKQVLSKEELANCIKKTDYPISNEDLDLIFADLECDTKYGGKVDMKLFYDRLSCWKDILEKASPDMIANLNMELFDDLDKKGEQLKAKEEAKQHQQLLIKPQSAVGAKRKIISRPFSSSTKKSDLAGRSGKALRDKVNYLKQAKMQEERELTELENIIQLGKKKQEFDCLHKIREACKIAQMLEKPYTFVTTPKGEAGLEISKKEGDNETLLTMEEFIREYKKLKREENSVGLKQGKANVSKQLLSLPAETPKMSTLTLTKTQNKDSKKEKQKKLLEVLKDTMKLTQILKEQLKILEEKGVYGGEKAKK